jgi:putative membrane protein
MSHSHRRSGGGLTSLVVRLVINALALYAAAQIVNGVSFTPANDWSTIFLVALLFGLVNALIRPVTLLITCLVNVVTLGLFTLVVNGAMLWLTSELATRAGLGFRVDGFVAAFLGALVISVISLVLTKILD